MSAGWHGSLDGIPYHPNKQPAQVQSTVLFRFGISLQMFALSNFAATWMDFLSLDTCSGLGIFPGLDTKVPEDLKT